MQIVIGKVLFSFLLSCLVFNCCIKETTEEDVSEYLDKLGRSLLDKLSHPGKDHEDLIRDLFDYNNHLEAIYTNITTGDSDQIKLEGYDLVQELVENGGPPHLNIEVDFDEFLFKVFKNDRETQLVHTVLEDNRKWWRKLKDMYEKKSQI